MKKRAHFLLQSDFYNLNMVCGQFKGLFNNYGVFLVGSSLEKKDYRDVDLRCIIADVDYVSLFGNDEENPPMRWHLICVSLSEYVKNRTGLPVDFQIQSMSFANKKFPIELYPRNAIGFPL